MYIKYSYLLVEQQQTQGKHTDLPILVTKTKGRTLYLDTTTTTKKTVHQSPRVGLTLKKSDGERH